MTNLEKQAPDGRLKDDAAVSNESQECVRFFCDTLTSLNKICEAQMEWLFKMAMITAESGASSTSAAGGAAEGQAGGDELAALVEQARAAVGRRHEEARAEAANAAEIPGEFCANVEAALAMAIRNSVNQQQQLYVLGQAILATCASRLIQSDPPSGGGA